MFIIYRARVKSTDITACDQCIATAPSCDELGFQLLRHVVLFWCVKLTVNMILKLPTHYTTSQRGRESRSVNGGDIGCLCVRNLETCGFQLCKRLIKVDGKIKILFPGMG